MPINNNFGDGSDFCNYSIKSALTIGLVFILTSFGFVEENNHSRQTRHKAYRGKIR